MNLSDTNVEDGAALACCPLSALAAGRSGVVVSVGRGLEDAARLSGLGIFEGVRLRVVRRRDPMIVALFGTRVGLASELAAHIHVHPCPHEPS
jgi:Fe2+ transport system protein FeoA